MSEQLERTEASTAWELRGAWASGRVVVLTLTDRCMLPRIQGEVEYVAVTGAYAIVDGWHVPCVDVLGVSRPHFSQDAHDA